MRVVRDGYTALKCHPLAVSDGGGLRHVSNRQLDRGFADLAFETVKALRAAVGSEVEIMLDLNGGLTTDETIRLCRRFEELDITWIEEPAGTAATGTPAGAFFAPEPSRPRRSASRPSGSRPSRSPSLRGSAAQAIGTKEA